MVEHPCYAVNSRGLTEENSRLYFKMRAPARGE